MKNTRPINLDLRTIHFPVTAIASILHRASGVILFIAMGILLWLLGSSLSSPEAFDQTSLIVTHPLTRFILWGILTSLAYHLCGGIRHMLMDFGCLPETYAVGQKSAWTAVVITVVISIAAGVLLW